MTRGMAVWTLNPANNYETNNNAGSSVYGFIINQTKRFDAATCTMDRKERKTTSSSPRLDASPGSDLQKDPTTRLLELNAEIAACAKQTFLQQMASSSTDYGDIESIEYPKDPSSCLEVQTEDLSNDENQTNKGKSSGESITLLSDSDEDNEKQKKSTTRNIEEEETYLPVLKENNGELEDKLTKNLNSTLNAPELNSLVDVIMLDDEDEPILSAPDKDSSVGAIEYLPVKMHVNNDSKLNEVELAVSSIIETEKCDTVNLAVTNLVQSRECINCICPKKNCMFVVADPFVLNHFRVAKKPSRTPYVCESCFDEAINKYSELCNVLLNHQPLLLEPMAFQPVLVEIIDSSDEEEEMEPVANESSDMMSSSSLDFLESELMNVLDETFARVDIHSQMSWTKNILEHKIMANTLIAQSIADKLTALQILGDSMSKRLYSTTGCTIEQLPPIDLNMKESGRNYGPDYPPDGEIEYPELNVNQYYYAVRQNMMSAWMTCKVIEIIEPTAIKGKQYKVKFNRNKGINTKIVSGTHIAYGMPPCVRLTVGVRVIALFHQEDTNQRTHYYPGVIAEPLQLYNEWRYLVFFDDGYAQYVSPENVRLVCEVSARVWEDVHIDSATFIKNYLSQYNDQRPMVQVKTGQRMVTEWHGKWLPARVQLIDASLVQMYFEDGKRTEWIYRGSTRLFPLFSKHVQKHSGGGLNKRNEPYVEYISLGDDTNQISQKSSKGDQANSKPDEAKVYQKPRTDEIKRTNVAKKSTSNTSIQHTQREIVPTVQHMNNSTIYVEEDNLPKGKVVYYTAKKHMPPRKFVDHFCNPQCVYDVKHNLSSYSPLAKPLLSGWERQICKGRNKKLVIYRAPCGRRLRNMSELHTYLRMTNCPLNVDNFDFDYLIHCLAEYVIDSYIVQKADLSDGREQMVVPSVNYYDNTTPPPCVYSEKRIPNQGVPLNLDPDFLCGCDCEDDCKDKSKCQCWQLTLDGATCNNPSVVPEEVGYEFKRLPDSVPTGIYECNSRCKCSKSCLNRVAQQPLQLKLQVFKTGNRGWGIRCLNDVPKGSFVCVYAGDLLTEQHANEAGDNYGDEYFAELDYIEVVESLKEGYEPEAAKDDDDIDDDDYNRNDDDSGDDEEIMSSKPHSIQTRYNTRTRNTEDGKSKMSNSGKDDDGSDEGEERQRISFVPDANTKELNYPNYKSIRKAFGKDEAVYIMDAKKTGNIGRYFNHSCAPNLFVQNVFVDTHDLRFPWVAFFALSHIRAGTELTWNYNYDVGSVPGKILFCECGASTCRGRLL